MEDPQVPKGFGTPVTFETKSHRPGQRQKPGLTTSIPPATVPGQATASDQAFLALSLQPCKVETGGHGGAPSYSRLVMVSSPQV